MYYIYIQDGIVHEIIPAENPAFPGVPITERYAPDFLADCVPVESLKGIQEGMKYDPGTGKFTEFLDMENPGGGGYSNHRVTLRFRDGLEVIVHEG